MDYEKAYKEALDEATTAYKSIAECKDGNI